MAVSKFTPSETSSIYIGLKHSNIAVSFVEFFTLINVLAFAVFLVDVVYCIGNSKPLEVHLITAFLSVGGAVLLRRSGFKRLKKKLAATEDKEELERLRPLNDKDLWNEAALHTCSVGFYVVGALATISLMLPLLVVPFAAIFWKKYVKFVAWYQKAREACRKCNDFDGEWKEFGNWIHDQKLSALKPAQLVEHYAKFCEAKAAKPVEWVKTNVLEQTAKNHDLRLEKEGLTVAWEFGKDFPVITGDPARVKLVKSENGENLFAIYLDSKLVIGYQCK